MAETAVILSGEARSRSEAATESKDPFPALAKIDLKRSSLGACRARRKVPLMYNLLPCRIQTIVVATK